MRFLTRLAAVAVILATVSLSVPAGGARPETAVGEPFCRLYLEPHDQFTRVVPPEPEGSALMSSAVLSTITVN